MSASLFRIFVWKSGRILKRRKEYFLKEHENRLDGRYVEAIIERVRMDGVGWSWRDVRLFVRKVTAADSEVIHLGTWLKGKLNMQTVKWRCMIHCIQRMLEMGSFCLSVWVTAMVCRFSFENGDMGRCMIHCTEDAGDGLFPSICSIDCHNMQTQLQLYTPISSILPHFTFLDIAILYLL